MSRARCLVGRAVFWATVLFVAPASLRAQPLSPTDVPAPLRPWIPWALDGATTYGCTWLPDGTPRCVWPGELTVALEPNGASFALAVTLDRPAPVPLPGDERRWPLEVRVDGRAVPVGRGRESGVPEVNVPAGAHRIEGRFAWATAPETLTIPATVGRVLLRTAEGSTIRPRRDGSTLWLQGATREAAVEDTLAIEVFRRIEDGVPMRITTRIALRVAGRPREIQLGRVLLEGSDPIAVTSDAPVRVTEAGELTVQVHPGSFQVEIVSARANLEAPLAALARAEIWPEQEIWVWQADEALRQVELSGADRIDPDRTNLPSEWRGGPTYLVDARHARVEFTTTRRGNPSPPPNQLSLSREIWLDIDGRGLTGTDEIRGTMHQGWRLELAQGVLGRATVDGQPHLVSLREGRAGVEIRRPAVDVRAEWRDDAASDVFDAVGWDEDAQHLEAVLHLAPGFRLFAAGGVDRADSWLSRWDLWDFFFVLVISFALGRLAGWRVGAVALAVLVLSYHEPNAPFLSWIPLVLALALAQALPEGRVRAVMRVAFQVFFAVFALIASYFGCLQLRRGLHPHIAEAFDEGSWEFVGAGTARIEPETEAATSTAEESATAEEPGGMFTQRGRFEEERRGQGGARESLLSSLSSYEPNAVLQTGPGVPNWERRGGTRITLAWDGPVARGTQVRLWLLTPGENALLSAILVALFVLLIVLLIRAAPRPPDTAATTSPSAPCAGPTGAPPPEHPPVARDETPSGAAGGAANVAAGAAVLLMASVFALAPSLAAAQEAPIPPREMLEELRTRLLRPPVCAPDCAEIATLAIAIEGDRLVVEADVQASALAAVAMPGPLDAWSPASLAVDGAPTQAAARIDDGYLYVRVTEGVHRVRLEGPLPSNDAFTLSFARPPRHAVVRAPGWEVDGLRDGHQVGSSIQLRRSVRQAAGMEAGEGVSSIEVTPWLALERRFALGVRWEMTTTVRRISAPGSPIVVRIPLVAGESVLSTEVAVEGGAALVTLGGNEVERTWVSALTPREELLLRAPEGERRSETWIVSCGFVWRCETSGLAPVRLEEDGRWNPQFRPFPGDTLRVRVTRLPAAEGQATTIDAATLSVRPGERLTIATLSVELRSSVGTTQTIHLPEGATLHSVTVDGERRSVEQRGRDVTLTIAPGSTRIELEWQEPRAFGLWYETSPVSLSGGAVNATISIQRPSRWLLWLGGPAWGPVVLFWPYLVVLLAVAIGLARVVRGGLTVLDWLLLALGLSVLPWQVAWIPPSWVALIEWRRRTPQFGPGWLFDLRQLAIVGWTGITAIVLYAAIHIGLLVDPDTSVVPASGPLEWYVDRLPGPEATLPTATIVSAPSWVYHVVMLLWSCWLAVRSIGWARWAFAAFMEGGLLSGSNRRHSPSASRPAALTVGPAGSARPLAGTTSTGADPSSGGPSPPGATSTGADPSSGGPSPPGSGPPETE